MKAVKPWVASALTVGVPSRVGPCRAGVSPFLHKRAVHRPAVRIRHLSPWQRRSLGRGKAA